MAEITLKSVYGSLLELNALELIQYYLFAFIFFHLIKFLLGAKLEIPQFEIYNRRILGAAVLAYFFLRTRSFFTFPQTDFVFAQNFSFIVFASFILMAYLVFYRLTLEKVVTPILTIMIIFWKRLESADQLGLGIKNFYQYRLSLKNLWILKSSSPEETMGYLKILTLNLIASIIIVVESSLLHPQIGIIVAIYCFFFIFFSWKFQILQWVYQLEGKTEFVELVYKAQRTDTLQHIKTIQEDKPKF